MKMNAMRDPIKLRLFLAVLLATCLFATAANAQSAYRGNFTLPFEVQWGMATLRAGEYQVTIDSAVPRFATVRQASGKHAVFVMPLAVDPYDGKGRSALIIAVRGNHSTVRELRLAEIGLTLLYQPRRGKAEKDVEEAQQIQQVPVLWARR